MHNINIKKDTTYVFNHLNFIYIQAVQFQFIYIQNSVCKVFKSTINNTNETFTAQTK